MAPAQGAWLWAVLLGIGNGAFPLALVMFSLRAAGPSYTSGLSAIGQGVGYLIAVVGPLGVGLLHDAVGGWTGPLLMLLGFCALQSAAAMVCGRAGRVGESER